MLLTEKIEKTLFSDSERIIINYLLEKKIDVKNKTIKEISQETYTNPSSFIRVAKKLGYTGWNEFKEVFLEEIIYLDSHFESIDANLSFNANDNYLVISNKLGALNEATIKDTLALIEYKNLKKAVSILLSSIEIKLFANNANLLISQEFALKMNRIKQYVSISLTDGEQLFDAANMRDGTCAIIISYSGETSRVLEIVPILRKRKIPILAITSLGNNSLANLADCVLRITTREKLYSKIGAFSSNYSICFLLDILYSCVFSENYQSNIEHKIKISRLADPRTSSVNIIKENK